MGHSSVLFGVAVPSAWRGAVLAHSWTRAVAVLGTPVPHSPVEREGERRQRSPAKKESEDSDVAVCACVPAEGVQERFMGWRCW